MQCPACGTLNGRADRLCRMCGGALPEPPKAPPIEVGPPPEEHGVGAGREADPAASASAATVAHRLRTSPPRCPSCFAVNVYSAAFCRSCGARLPEEPVYDVPDDGSALPASGDRTGPAWEHGTGFFDLGALFATMRDSLLSPNVTFSNMRREGGGTRPVTYVLAVHLVFLPVYIAMIWFAGRELRTMAHQWGQMTLPAAIEENLRQVAGAYFGGFMGGMGGGSTGIWMGIGMGVFHSVPITVALGLGALSSAYALARGLFRRQFRRRSGELDGLADRLVDAIEEGGRRR